MANYISITESEKKQMLDAVGVSEIEELFGGIPEKVTLKAPLAIPHGLPEQKVFAKMSAMAAKNKVYRSIFRGGGAYRHYIPAVVDSICSKEEFVTAYTPYQPEISQGVLQAIFEYQSMICRLTDMDVSNASVYDGATAAAEAVAMCKTPRKNKALLSSALNPQIIETVKTYCFGSDTPYEILPHTDGKTNVDFSDSDASCIIISQPNFYGVIEDVEKICENAHGKGIKVIVCCNPISLALLKTPGECGADIAVGDAQPLGIPLSFGGPYLGFMACKTELTRKLPGRIVGQTTDTRGNRAFVLTLQAREQHIRREKASSNICSNQALCALRAGVYLSAMGSRGLERAASHCAAKAHYMAAELCKIKGVSLAYKNEFFNEFLTICPKPEAALSALDDAGILGGLVVDGKVLWCVTEQNSIDEIDEAVGIVREVCGK
ncbi:MAG: aminomethyl-transferring glycine dehydrogenase subunit GcvPA [Firmicutes bacterium]|nr:aminomethyl-transferring glycine dehydrogenase subunit GcvPA [Bacillota bacterium]